MQSIYTDGSCIPNPGPGGWGFIFISSTEIWKVNGGSRQTTNNQMELTAVIEALKFTDETNIKIFSDSQYVINCAKGKWKRKTNLELWAQFDHASNKKKIEWEWVKAHNGNRWNEQVDQLAKNGVPA